MSTLVLTGAILTGCNQQGEEDEDSQDASAVPTYQESIIQQVQEHKDQADASAAAQSDASGNTDGSSVQTSGGVTKSESNRIKWTFKEQEDIRFENSTYTKIQPFDQLKLIHGTIALPSYRIDTEKVKSAIREDRILSKNVKFATFDNERRTYKEYENAGTLTAYYRRSYLMGYNKDNEKPVSPNDSTVDIAFGYAQDSTGYDSPEFYELVIRNTRLDQEDVKKSVINVFGPQVGNYLAEGVMPYRNDANSSKDILSYEKVFKTPDTYSTYSLQRRLEYDKTTNSFSFTFRVMLFDSYISRNNPDNKFEWGIHDYKPFTPTLDLSGMLLGDVGVTDFNNQQSFLNKALNYGGDYDRYGRTSFANSTDDAITLEEIRYDSGETIYDYEVLGERRNENDSATLTGDVYVKINGIRDNNGEFELKGFSITLPTCVLDKELYKNQLDIYQKLTDQCKLQAKKLFGYRDSNFNRLHIEDTSGAEKNIVKYDYPRINITVFGTRVKSDLTFTISSTDKAYKASISVKMLNN